MIIAYFAINSFELNTWRTHIVIDHTFGEANSDNMLIILECDGLAKLLQFTGVSSNIGHFFSLLVIDFDPEKDILVAPKLNFGDLLTLFKFPNFVALLLEKLGSLSTFELEVHGFDPGMVITMNRVVDGLQGAFRYISLGLDV